MARRTVGACPPIHCSGCTHTDRKEVAQNFKERGNEYFRDKRYREALGFYTQGVEAKPDDGRLREALLLNRAACNLELRASLASPLPCLPLYPQAFLLGYLENYGSVLRDCATVIGANLRAPSKAYYRAGLALLALERPDEALDVCARAGETAADDVGFKTLRARAEEKHAEMARKVEERRERARRAAEEKMRMEVAFTVRVSTSSLSLC
jgi:tetratricopeptide (TPR) repeat protein